MDNQPKPTWWWGNRYMALLGGLLIEFCAGTAYGYSVYSSQFKDQYGFSQSNVNLISSIGNVGMYFGVPGGLFYDRYGARLTCLVGGLLTCVGYFLAWLNSKDLLGTCSPTIMTICFAIAWQGSSWLDCAGVSLTISNFPANRGLVLGLCKCFFGISGSILGQFYLGFKLKHASWPGAGSSADDSIPFLLFMSLVALAGTALAIPFLHKTPSHPPPPPVTMRGRRGIYWGYAVVLVLATFLTTAGIIEKVGSGVSDGVSLVFSCLTVLLMLLFIGVPKLSRECGDDDENVKKPPLHSLLGAEDRLAMMTDPSDAMTSSAAGEESGRRSLPAGGHDRTICEALQTVNFWLIAIAAFCHTGTGLMVINNAAQIAQATLGHADDSVGSLFAILLGTVNAFGRIAAGLGGDAFAHRVQRPVLLGMASLCMGLGCLVFAFASYALLFLAAPLVAFGYGCYWALTPVILAELYGQTNFGTIYNSLAISTSAGGLSISAGLATYFYNEHTHSSSGTNSGQFDADSSSNKCYGSKCYQDTFLICMVLCCVSAVAMFTVAWRTRSGMRSSMLSSAVMRREASVLT